jgi:hypothetical protein
MDLTGVLLRAGAARPHVLAVTMPGATAVRLAAEEQLRHRGWPTAMTPADADILLIAGDPVSPMTEVLAEIWTAMPAPRARAGASGPGEVAAALEAARAQLGDRTRQQALGAAGTGRSQLGHGIGADDQAVREHSAGSGGHHGREAAGGGPGDMDGGEHSRAMGGMNMGGMAMPGGLPMADRGEDRDGLRLDQLHVPLGPVLPDWPAGLVIRVTLQGDVIQQAEPEALGAGGGSFWDEPWARAAAGEVVATGDAAGCRTAAHLDSLGRFLAVAGWDAAAATARRLRDDVLAGAPSGRLRRDAHRFTRRVARSRTLAWLTGGLGVLSASDAAAATVRGPALRAAGDVTARYRRWCAELDGALVALDDGSPLDPAAMEPPRGPADDTGAPSAGLLAVLPRLLTGTELAGARLIVASLDPDLDQLPARVGAAHGH